MKRVITICLLVVTLFAGGMTMDAKTTKKKSKAKSTSTRSSSFDGASCLSTNTFMHDEGFFSPSTIAEDLKDNGNFKLTSTSNVRTEYGEGYVTAKKYVYNGGNVIVSLYVYDGYTIEVHLKFTGTGALNAFVRRMQDDGWEYSYSNGSSKTYFWAAGSMYVKGLNVMLTYGG